MGIYIFLYFWSILTSVLVNTKLNMGKLLYLYVNLIPLIFFATFRDSNVGTDLVMYIDFFHSLKYSNSFSDTRMEYGYTILNYISSMLSDSSTCLLYIISCITYVCIFWCFYKCSSNIVISIIVFIGLYMYCMSFNVMRQYLAVAFICMAYYFLDYEKIIKACLMCLCAALFHKTAIVMFPLVIIYPYINNFRKYMIFFICIIISYFLTVLGFENLIEFLPRYSLQYATSVYSQSRALTASIVLPLVTLVILLFTNFVLYKNRYFDKKLGFLNIMLLLYSLSWIASFEVYIFYRFVYYFEIFLCLAIPYIVDKFFRPKNEIYFFLYLMMFVYLFLHLNKNTSLVVPYMFLF